MKTNSDTLKTIEILEKELVLFDAKEPVHKILANASCDQSRLICAITLYGANLLDDGYGRERKIVANELDDRPLDCGCCKANTFCPLCRANE